MDLVKQKLLDDFKKSNKIRREKTAIKYGFNSAEEFLAYLENKEIPVKQPVEKPTIHNVVLLDATGSMSGDKYNNSKSGIIKELEWIKEQTDINYTCTLIEFIEQDVLDKVRYKNHFVLSAPHAVKTNFYEANGDDTPLYKAILDTIELILSNIKIQDKVLLKIYTDGDNNSLGSFLTKCKEEIARVQTKNFTVTFVGTTKDLNKIKHDLKLEDSNCLAVDNTGEGFKEAFKMSLASTQIYANRVLKGENVSKGFYKKIIS